MGSDDMIRTPTYQRDDVLKCFDEITPGFGFGTAGDELKELFRPVGYNDQQTAKLIYEKQVLEDQAAVMAETKLHYRRYFRDELENIPRIMGTNPFQEFDIMLGQSRGLNKGGFLSLMFRQKLTEDGNVTNEKKVGEFKGIIRVYSTQKQK